MPLSLAASRDLFAPHLAAPRWLVAYSGGMDSHVLLHLLANCPGRPPITALHINHQLQADSSQWVEHCRGICAELDVDFSAHVVSVETNARESLEDKARQARYAVFEQVLEAGQVLFLGHHRDDQVETFLMRLLRGSGSHGAGAIPAQRTLGAGCLQRPLLDIPRSAIVSYAQQHSLHWVDDPSNSSDQFDRNFLRLEVLPQLEQRWPQYRSTLARAARLSRESAILNDELAALDCQRLAQTATSQTLSISALQELTTLRQKNLLRYWLASQNLALPNAAQLQSVLDDVVNASVDAEPLGAWPGVEVRRFRNVLYAMPPLSEFDAEQTVPWDTLTPIVIEGVGQLSAKVVTACGLQQSVLDRGALSLRFRQGGERCQPVGRNSSQTLKKLFQEYNIETWLRDRVPLIYSDDQLVAVGDYWVCQGFQARADEPGIELHWNRSSMHC